MSGRAGAGMGPERVRDLLLKRLSTAALMRETAMTNGDEHHAWKYYGEMVAYVDIGRALRLITDADIVTAVRGEGPDWDRALKNLLDDEPR